ncbi:hypothetical protein HPP92_023800 [Vanilla planifolia]|uniref:LsmAD domain-containing protein n=1 Tax=Vanilla planifolia TaxID=51239 RepID=A0A835UAV0_VANPL|nr:hypothetical protein HPP92_023800 [Vanilla planifolia]
MDVKEVQNEFSQQVNGGKTVQLSSSSRDRLTYISSCLIGLHVEVHVRNGSVFSGIFCTVNSKDFGIVLKMAQLIKDGSTREQKSIPETLKRPQTIIIPAREFVQIIAKNVPLSSDEFSNSNARDRRKDFMIDSVISRSNIVDVERELERWTPDVDDPECPELDNIFDGTWNRNWDQFETNETLFGVKSTFNEEFYTTKLDRGPQTRDREREASRIAREIEGEESHDLHIAEERGFKLLEGFDIDEERLKVIKEVSSISLVERLGFGMEFIVNVWIGVVALKNGAKRSICYHLERNGEQKDIVDLLKNVEQLPCKPISSSMDPNHKLGEMEDDMFYTLNLHLDFFALSLLEGLDPISGRLYVDVVKGSYAKKVKSHACQQGNTRSERKAKFLNENSSKVSVDAHIPMDDKVLVDKKRLPSPSDAPLSQQKWITMVNLQSIGPSLSPSSSMGSLSSEKSTLNPNAKEFKLNPNAKSFTPSTFRPSVPMSEGSFYYTGTVPAVPPMQTFPWALGFLSVVAVSATFAAVKSVITAQLPFGPAELFTKHHIYAVAVGPPFGTHQPVYNPQAPQLQPPQPYIHANGHMLPYGQQMIVGQPRPFYYVPTYPSALLLPAWKMFIRFEFGTSTVRCGLQRKIQSLASPKQRNCDGEAAILRCTEMLVAAGTH